MVIEVLEAAVGGVPQDIGLGVGAVVSGAVVVAANSVEKPVSLLSIDLSRALT
jgi:hypothetical protein